MNTLLTDPSYAPDTILLLSKRMHRTSSSCPSRILKHAPHSMSHSLQKENIKTFSFQHISIQPTQHKQNTYQVYTGTHHLKQ